MIVNHTAMAQLFGRTVSQYDKLRKRNAFLEQYRREPMFADGLEEFDSARWAQTALYTTPHYSILLSARQCLMLISLPMISISDNLLHFMYIPYTHTGRW